MGVRDWEVGRSECRPVMGRIRSPALLIVDRLDACPEGIRQCLTSLGRDTLVVVTTRMAPVETSAKVLTVDPMSTDNRRKLFECCWSKSFHADSPTLDKLCRLSGGLPLVIEHLADRVERGQWTQLDDLTNLAETSDWPAILHETIGWSFEQLDPPTRRTLIAATAFRSSFSVESLAYVLDSRERRVAASLEVLLRRGLLQQDSNTEHPKYVVYPIVTEFLQREHPPDHDAMERYRSWWARFFSPINRMKLLRRDPAMWADVAFHLLDFEHAILTATAPHFRGATENLQILWSYYIIRGPVDRLKPLANHLLAQELPDSLRALALTVPASIRRFGDLTRADLHEALPLASESMRPSVLVELGKATLTVDPAEALRIARRAVKAARRQNDHYCTSRAWGLAGTANGLLGNDTTALRALQRQTNLMRTLGIPPVMSTMNLGSRHALMGNFDTARALLRQAVELAIAHDEQAGLPLYNLGCLHYLVGDLVEAETVFTSAARHSRRQGEGWRLRFCQARLAEIAWLSGFPSSASALSALLTHSEPLGPDAKIESRLNLAAMWMGEGKSSQALETIQALDWTILPDDPTTRELLLRSQWLEHLLQNPDEALAVAPSMPENCTGRHRHWMTAVRRDAERLRTQH